ncbi:PDR/VanB family oxidoreductase [Homoserinimonas sp. OAct 916]|uniref:PDR/VanB family oxidoreductase n=1 Tax=Homoserinimonas sp. OAct 916 TaxID=2211450 RepID=UPI000DBE49E6|nr:PDR/VanB family oxidoreductase [Homoserinimonas sp. OAct 916]
MTSTHQLLHLCVIGIEPVAERVRALTLGLPEGGDLPDWQPGSHIDLHLPGDILRQYSLCSDPGERSRWRIAVLHEPDGRGGSVAVHEKIQVGDMVQVSQPKDNFGYRPGASDLLFVAGGIGITPMLPMVHAAARAGVNWHLVYLGRSREAMSFLPELADYGNRVTVHPSATLGSMMLSGALDELLATRLDDPEVYACGPERMLEALAGWCSDERAHRLHVERFTATATEPQAGDTAFTVETSDGTEIEVAADETILTALVRVGIPVLNSCQEGICGTCETVVLEGFPDHRDQLLSDEERASNETMMVCVSRCKGKRLVLEL